MEAITPSSIAPEAGSGVQSKPKASQRALCTLWHALQGLLFGTLVYLVLSGLAVFETGTTLTVSLVVAGAFAVHSLPSTRSLLRGPF